jgi:hypothetical protein
MIGRNYQRKEVTCDNTMDELSKEKGNNKERLEEGIVDKVMP